MHLGVISHISVQYFAGRSSIAAKCDGEGGDLDLFSLLGVASIAGMHLGM